MFPYLKDEGKEYLSDEIKSRYDLYAIVVIYPKINFALLESLWNSLRRPLHRFCKKRK